MNDVENSEEEEQDPGVEDMVEDIESKVQIVSFAWQICPLLFF